MAVIIDEHYGRPIGQRVGLDEREGHLYVSRHVQSRSRAEVTITRVSLRRRFHLQRVRGEVRTRRSIGHESVQRHVRVIPDIRQLESSPGRDIRYGHDRSWTGKPVMNRAAAIVPTDVPAMPLLSPELGGPALLVVAMRLKPEQWHKSHCLLF
jgi:hypothetical protein